MGFSFASGVIALRGSLTGGSFGAVGRSEVWLAYVGLRGLQIYESLRALLVKGRKVFSEGEVQTRSVTLGFRTTACYVFDDINL